jgi:probable HAF family extracellular repeat protein
MSIRLNRTLIAAGLALALAGGNAAAASFMTIDAAQNGFLQAMSRDGHIVAGSYVGGGLYAGAWEWRQGAGYQDLPLLTAQGMNSWGQPIAGDIVDGGGYEVAATYYSDSGANPTVVGPYPGSQPQDIFWSSSYGVSDNGIVVGLAQNTDGNAIAFRWTQGEGMVRMPVDRPDTYSRANGISGSGGVIYGWNDREDGFRTGVIWVDGSPTYLHNPGQYGDSFGSPPGEALGSNYDGSVVVGQGYYDDNLYSEAWRWTQAGGTQPIGVIVRDSGGGGIGSGFRSALVPQYTAPTGIFANSRIPAQPSGFFYPTESYALAVSEDGNTIVGNSGIGNGGGIVDAFIWTPATGMVFLAEYAEALGVTIPDGFTLYSANAISADGLTIAGQGIDPTGSFVVPWIIDLHSSQLQQTYVTAVGTIAANDLADGPFAGYPVGAAVTMTFTLASDGIPVNAGYASDYSILAGSFQLVAAYQDPVTYEHFTATETLDAAATPLLHMSNDNPRADALGLDPTATATAGQTVTFSASNAAGTLFDSDQVAHVNRSMDAGLFNASDWKVSEAGHSMQINVQWVSLHDDPDAIFHDGFEGN